MCVCAKIEKTNGPECSRSQMLHKYEDESLKMLKFFEFLLNSISHCWTEIDFTSGFNLLFLWKIESKIVAFNNIMSQFC